MISISRPFLHKKKNYTPQVSLSPTFFKFYFTIIIIIIFFLTMTVSYVGWGGKETEKGMYVKMR